MSPFTEMPVERGPEVLNAHRDAFLSQPDHFFQETFQGRLPSPSEKIAWVDRAARLMIPDRVFRNDTYEVFMNVEQPFIHLDIRRRDGGAVTSWREFQRIKNDLVGPEHEAMELFPAESRLIDTGNQYHLWVYADPGKRFPLGWWRRCVLPTPATSSAKKAGHDTATGNATFGITLTGGSVAIFSLVVGSRR